MENKEHIYDDEISPLVEQILKKCGKYEIPVSMIFQYGDHEDNHCSVTAVNNQCSLKMQMAAAAVNARGNLDGFLIWAIEYAKRHGHNSIFLNVLEKAKL